MWILLIASADIKFFGQFRSRYEYRNDKDFTKDQKDLVSFVNMRTRFGLNVSLNEYVFLRATIQDSRIYGSTGAAVSPDNPLEGIGYTATNSRGIESLDIIEAFVGFRGGPAKLLIGRQRFFYGEHRLIGTFDWSNVGNSFDAIRGIINLPYIDVEAFTAILRNSMVIEGPVELPTGSDVSTSLYGVYTNVKLKGENFNFNLSPYVFTLNDRAKSSAGGIGYPNRWEIDTIIDWGYGWVDTIWKEVDPKDAMIISPGAYLKGNVKLGAFTPFLAGEFTYQTGRAWAYIMKAFAAFGRIGFKYSFGESMFLSMFGEYDIASGAKDGVDPRKDSIRYTPYNFFPTNHIHYGYGDLFSWKNLKAFRVNLSGGYGPVVVKLDYWNFSLYSKYDHWYHAGQGILFSPSSVYYPDTLKNLPNSVGNEYDITVVVKLLKNLKVLGGFTYFIPSSLRTRIYEYEDKSVSPMKWGFMQIVVNF